MYQIKAEILSNEIIIPAYYRMCLDAPEIAREAKPGQFIHIRVEDGYDPLLRRPLSIHKSENGKIEVLYRVVGKGTKLLSNKKRGKKIDTLGPLGQGFKIKPDLRRIVLVAGGMGVAPLYFLVERLSGCKKGRGEKGSEGQSLLNDSLRNKNLPDILLILGSESKKSTLCLEDFSNLDIKVEVVTEDGSQGYKGLVSDFLSHLLQEDSQIDLLCACGPIPMLKKIAQLTRRYGIPCQVLLEQRMGCGIGACLGCGIAGQNSYLRVCRDGPVFQAQQIRWDDLDNSQV